MFLYYQNSFLASAVSIFGCLMIFMGLTDTLSEKYLFIGLGIVLVIAGKLISTVRPSKNGGSRWKMPVWKNASKLM